MVSHMIFRLFFFFFSFSVFHFGCWPWIVFDSFALLFSHKISLLARHSFSWLRDVGIYLCEVIGGSASGGWLVKGGGL